VADIEVRRAHTLGLEGAREAAGRMMAALEQRYGLRGTWEGNVLRFERPGVSGHLAVGEDDLHLAVSLGFMLRAMRGTIHEEVTREVDRIFGGGATPSVRA
jgi:putative polyhydroxyalkanoate system protein